MTKEDAVRELAHRLAIKWFDVAKVEVAEAKDENTDNVDESLRYAHHVARQSAWYAEKIVDCLAWEGVEYDDE